MSPFLLTYFEQNRQHSYKLALGFFHSASYHVCFPMIKYVSWAPSLTATAVSMCLLVPLDVKVHLLTQLWASRSLLLGFTHSVALFSRRAVTGSSLHLWRARHWLWHLDSPQRQGWLLTRLPAWSNVSALLCLSLATKDLECVWTLLTYLIPLTLYVDFLFCELLVQSLQLLECSEEFTCIPAISNLPNAPFVPFCSFSVTLCY